MQIVNHVPEPHHSIGKFLSEDPVIHRTSTIHNCKMGVYSEVMAGCYCKEITLGNYSYLATDVKAIWCEIGHFTSIASHCVINPGNHPYHRVTQSHCTYRRKQYGFADTDDDEFFQWRKDSKVTIGNDVWMGHGVYVMPGATISDGAVVAAGSVVTRNNPIRPYEIVAGSPAKMVKKRFSDDIIEKLLFIKFWNWDRAKLEENFDLFNDLERFVQIHT